MFFTFDQPYAERWVLMNVRVDMPLAAGPVAPIDAHHLLVFLLQLGILLGAAVLLGRLATRYGMPAVVGELAVGVLLGPSLLGKVAPGAFQWLFPADPAALHLLDAVGQTGVLLLVGITGMHVDLGLVRRRGTTAVAVSAGGLLVPLGFGIAVGFLLPRSLSAGASPGVFAMFIGVALCVSAIPVISKILLEMDLLHRNIGQLALAAAAVDDVAGWLMLSVVSAMATTGIRTGPVVHSVAAVVVVVLVTAFVARPLIRPVLRLATRLAPSGTTAVVVTILILSGAATQALGLEAILGTFLCGLLIGSSRVVEPARLVPLRTFVLGVLAPLFFATAGLRMDLGGLRRPAVLLAGLAVLGVAIAGKYLGVLLAAWLRRLGARDGFALAASLNARGIVQIVVAATGLRLGVLSTGGYTIIVLVAIVTSLMAPPTLHLALRHTEVTAEERERQRVLTG